MMGTESKAGSCLYPPVDRLTISVKRIKRLGKGAVRDFGPLGGLPRKG